LIEYNKRNSIIVGLMVAIISVVLLVVGFKFILTNGLLIQNIISFIILSIILGGISSALHYFKLKIAFPIFLMGIIIGFFEMYRTFLNGLNGWSDLVGIIFLLTWVLIGLITGLVVQFVRYLYRKAKRWIFYLQMGFSEVELNLFRSVYLFNILIFRSYT